MSDEDFQSLKDSIEAVGVLNPITLFEGQVIDGWHRYQAATELMMDCPSVELDPAIDPKGFVIGQNKARRHITLAQLGIAVSAVHRWAPAGKPRTECEVKTNAEMAKLAGVSERTISQAKEVQEKAAPEVVEAVKAGTIGLPKAVAIAKLPKAEQAAAIEKPLPKKEKRTLAGELARVQPTDLEGYSEADRLRDELTELGQLVDELRIENAALSAAANGEGDPTYQGLLKELRDENRVLQASCKALKSQLDATLAERASMLKQLAYWQKRVA